MEGASVNTIYPTKGRSAEQGRRVRILCASVLSIALLSACAKVPTSVTTPAGKTAYTADQVVKRVNELQAAAIQAEATGGLPTSTTRIIVTFCVAADKTLAATPAGWQQAILTAWNQAKTQLPSRDIANPVIAAAIAGVDVVLAAFSATGGN